MWPHTIDTNREMSKNKKDPIGELCKSNCEILPIEQTESEKTKYASYVQRTTYRRVYEGTPYDLRLITPEFDTLEIEFTAVGTPEFYEIYLRQLPTYTTLPPYTFIKNRGIVGGLLMNTSYEVDVVAYYVSNERFRINKKRIFHTLNESPPFDMQVTTPTGLVRRRTEEGLFFNLNFKDASGVVSNYKVNTVSANTYDSQFVYVNQNNIIPNLIANETYTLELTSFYGNDGVVNPDYTLTQTHQMINETTVSNIFFTGITGHDIVVNFTSAAGDLTDVSYSIFFNDVSVKTFGSLESDIVVPFQDIIYNYSYDVKIVTHYKTNNNSYLIDSSFVTLNETYVRNFTIINGPTNVKISFDHSPDFTVNDTYILNLIRVLDSQSIGGEVITSGDLLLPIDISSIFLSELVVDNVYNLSVESIYNETGHRYSNNFEFKTLNEGIIESCSIDRTSTNELILSGASVQFMIVPFNESSPIQYDIRISTSPQNDDSGLSFSREPNNLFFDNVLTKNTEYFVFVKSIYATDNSYQSITFDLSFQTRNEEALPQDTIQIVPYGTYIEFDISYIPIGDISTNFEFEITDLNVNTLTLSGEFVSLNNYAEVNTLSTHGHGLIRDTLYRFKLISKYGNPVREYYTFIDFTTLDEFPLYIDVSDNFVITGRQASFDISGSEDLTRPSSYIFYDISLNDGQNVSGEYNIFPVTFIDLKPNFEYTVMIRSIFDICGNDNSGNFYDISYVFTTLNESEVEKIVFDDTSYNPYSNVLVQNGQQNPSSKHAVAFIHSPSGDIHTLYIRVESRSDLGFSLNALYTDICYNTSPLIQEIDGLKINTTYNIYTRTQYTTGNVYEFSRDFQTLNEEEIDLLNNFYIYTTNDSVALDFLQTGQDFSYIFQIDVPGEDISFVQTGPPLDFDISNLTVSLEQQFNIQHLLQSGDGTINTNIVQAMGGYYVFNETSYDANGYIGVDTGTYYFDVPSTHPIGFVVTDTTVLDVISYDILHSSSSLNVPLSGVSYYSGIVQIEIKKEFTGTISYHCGYHGYMGGQDKLVHTVSTATVRQNTPYTGYLYTHYNVTNNIYKTPGFTITLGFTSEQYIRNGTFTLESSGSLNNRGFSVELPTEWTSSENVVISAQNIGNNSIFYKQNPNSSSSYCAIIYLPSNLNESKTLIQSIDKIRGPNSISDNNLYQGRYEIGFYVANHKEEGQTFSFGNLTDPTIAYDVKLVNIDPPVTIASKSFVNTSTTYSYQTLFLDVSTSYNHVEFQINRTGNEKNNLYIMDLSMVSVDS